MGWEGGGGAMVGSNRAGVHPGSLKEGVGEILENPNYMLTHTHIPSI